MTPPTNIMDRADCARAMWDFGVFNDCFAYRIRFSDLDGIVHVRAGDQDFFHVFEGQRGTSCAKARGQALLLSALSLLPNTSVITVAGDNATWDLNDVGLYVRGQYHHKPGWKLEDVRRRLSDWYDHTGRGRT